MAFEYYRARSITEQDRGRAILPIEWAAHGVRTDHKDTVKSGGDEPICGHEAIGEPRAHRLDVAGATTDTQLCMDGGRRTWHQLIRGGRGDHHEIDVVTGQSSAIQSLLARMNRHFAGRTTHVTFLDAGSLEDPLVAGVHHFGQVIVGQDLGRQIGSPADNSTAAHDLRNQAIG